MANSGPTLRSLFPNKDAVKIYPDDFIENGDEKKDLIMAEFVDRKTGHFTDKRVAVLFRPRVTPYNDINFPVGYWTQVLGLGETPEGVTFSGNLGVYALPANTDNHEVGSLDTFWRSAENFVSDTTFIENPLFVDNTQPPIPLQWSVPVGSTAKDLASPKYFYGLPDHIVDGENTSKFGMLWAVSQAAPIRRIKAKNLHLALGDNYASGGFAANLDVEGFTNFAGQQQFCIRNGRIGDIFGMAWSAVLVGCEHKGWPTKEQEPHVVTDESTTSVRIEKPFIFIGDDDAVYLGIPKMKTDSASFDHAKLSEGEKVLIDNDEKVKVFHPSDSIDDIQEAAANGLHIVLSPGIYNWKKTLELSVDNQVLLGIGMATIEAPCNGKPCIYVSSKSSGVRISGLSLEASVLSDSDYVGSSLLDWGESQHVGKGNSKKNPGAIHDLFCFVGGRSVDRSVKAQTMVRIYSSNVVGDNLWLWRADHTKLAAGESANRPDLSEYHLTTNGECQCDTGLEVRGHDVLFNGLAVEHTYKDMVKWYGTNGKVNFYQSELPYDVSPANYKDIAGYRVHEGAEGHVAKGVGVYSYFRDYADVEVEAGVVDHADSKFENIFTVWLNGNFGIQSVINGKGGPTQKSKPEIVLSHPSTAKDQSEL